MKVQQPTASSSVDRLGAAIDEYSRALGTLRLGDRPPSIGELVRYRLLRRGNRSRDRADLEKCLMCVLVARDRIRRELAASGPPPPDLLLDLAKHDRTLRLGAPDIVTRLGPESFVVWRDMLPPAARGWWWRLDVVATRDARSGHPFWTLATRGLVFAISLAIAFEIGRRFIRGGDILGYFGLAATLSTVLLTALIASGRRVEQFLGRLEVDPRIRSRATTALALAILFLLLGLRASLPWISDRVTQSGIDASQDQRYITAIDRYELAISLHPENAAAHYYLGLAHEDLLEHNEAMRSYRTALAVNGNASFEWDYAATNNLARLHIIHRDDFSTAFELIDSLTQRQDFHEFRACLFDASAHGVGNCPGSPEELFDRYDDAYKLYKNRGWASLGLGDYQQAERDLAEAIRARNARGALGPSLSGRRSASLPGAALPASASCLLGQVYERQGATQLASDAYLDCIRWAPIAIGDRIEREWLLAARAFLSDLES